MEIQLINGTFSIADAEALLTAIFNAKISFHEQKLKAVPHTAEEIQWLEKKIAELELSLKKAIAKLKEQNQTHTTLTAYIDLTMKHHLHQ